MQSLTYIEIEVPNWVETSPPGPATLWRFAKPAQYLPRNVDCIPSIIGVEYHPAVISLCEKLGQRATLTIRLRDHRHIMNGESFVSGTFWGKWRGRYGTRLRGVPVTWRTGVVGQALEDMDTLHFIL